MSAGVVPVALRGAGPSEIITDGRDGALVDNATDLIRQSAALLTDARALTRIGTAADRRAADFKPDVFTTRFAAAVASDGRPRLAIVDAAQ